MDLGLRDRVFVVTAASSGLGGATARAAGGRGREGGAGRPPRGRAGRRRRRPGRRTAPSRSPPTWRTRRPSEDACRLALDTFGRLDGALVSVGGPAAGTALGTPDSDWVAGFDAVFLAALRVTRAVVGHGTADDLAIAWVLSTSVKAPIGGLAVSNGLRPGLAMLVKQLADELGTGRDSGRRPVARAGWRQIGSSTSTRSPPTRPPRGPPTSRGSRCVATGDPRSSAGSRPSCSRRPRPTSPAAWWPWTAAPPARCDQGELVIGSTP